ncbi:MAG: toprim domain-containing protein, partial [Gammaproteobacteria bacterium]|nr:toprim domain-containing protein [Gammaproteobacteria bacterium]
FHNTEPVKDYLKTRGLSAEIIDKAIKKKAVGFNDYIGRDKQSKQPIEKGKYGHCGPGAAFITRSMNPGRVMAVDTRYFDAEANGGVKTTCLGEKSDYPWFMDLATLKAANTVYLVESPINALSIEDCGMPKTAAVAIRGVSNVQNMDFHFCMGKKVVLVMDNDKADEHGKRPGTEAAWLLYEKLTALNIPTHIVNQIPWCESDYNDVNDILKDLDKYKLQTYLKDLEQWAIAGLPGKVDTENEKLREYKGRSRLYLPPHDYAKYWRFGCHEDFSFYTKTVKDKDGENEHDIQQDVCGFRVASVSKLSIASVKSVTTGEPDMMPRVKFAASVQVPRLGHLLRRVFNDEDLHNLDRWRKFGPIFSPAVFSRLLNILERSAVLSERSAINFVGLAWKNGKPAVNEGADCYFTDPDKQCAYDNLIFPSGPTGNARRVIDAYQATFSQNAALILLVWSLGAHIKAFLGFWPHMELQAEKGSGKSVVTERLEGTIGMTMFSGQSINTEYRILTTVSHTFHPIGWEEMSAREQKVIDKA